LKFEDLDKIAFLAFRKTHSQTETARYFGTNERSVRNWERKLGTNPGERAAISKDAIAFPAPAEHDCLVGREIIYSDRCIVISDAEIPDHSVEIFEAVISIAQKFGIKDLIINGDLVALDSMSAWAKAVVRKVFFREELEASQRAVQVFLQTFDRIFWHSGNHERRLNHKVDGELSIGDFFVHFAGVKFSEYSSCILKSGGQDIFITHQKNYGSIPLSVPRKMFSTKLMNILCGHSHHLAMSYDPSGRYWLVEGGHCRNAQNTVYKQMRDTTHPEWNPGFVMIDKGRPYLIDHNNLDFWLSVAPNVE
jgi:predicted phosphodiesterase